MSRTLNFRFGNLEVEASYDPSENEIEGINSVNILGSTLNVLEEIESLGYDTAGITDLLVSKCQEQAAEQWAEAIAYAKELYRSED